MFRMPFLWIIEVYRACFHVLNLFNVMLMLDLG